MGVGGGESDYWLQQGSPSASLGLAASGGGGGEFTTPRALLPLQTRDCVLESLQGAPLAPGAPLQGELCILGVFPGCAAARADGHLPSLP